MLIHPQFDPVALSLGPVSIHWYGITYLVAFLLFLWLARSRLQHAPYATLANRGIWKVQHIDDLMTYGVLGVVLGGRLGYCLFYQPSYYAAHPLEIAYIWQGGMSFHGGMLGVIAAMAPVGWAISSMASCGAGQPRRICPGPWCSRKAARTCRAIRRRFTSFC